MAPHSLDKAVRKKTPPLLPVGMQSDIAAVEEDGEKSDRIAGMLTLDLTRLCTRAKDWRQPNAHPQGICYMHWGAPAEYCCFKKQKGLSPVCMK